MGYKVLFMHTLLLLFSVQVLFYLKAGSINETKQNKKAERKDNQLALVHF